MNNIETKDKKAIECLLDLYSQASIELEKYEHSDEELTYFQMIKDDIVRDLIDTIRHL